jgi:hypothetical protein
MDRDVIELRTQDERRKRDIYEEADQENVAFI